MKKRQAIKNVKSIFCRFDMDIPEERAAWRILQRLSKEQEQGQNISYNTIIATAIAAYYGEDGEFPMTNRQLLEHVISAVEEGFDQAIKTLAIQPSAYQPSYFYQPLPPNPTTPQEELNHAAINFLDGLEQ